jgi:hypothetical protein
VKTPGACIIASSSMIRAKREREGEIISKGRAGRHRVDGFSLPDAEYRRPILAVPLPLHLRLAPC